MKRFTPLHLHVVRMYWDGVSPSTIDNKLSKPSGWASKILSSPEASEIIERLKNATIDTMVEVQTKLQAAAPILLSKELDFALSGNGAAESRARQLLLEKAGHVATRQVEIRRPDHVEEEFRNKSEAQIKAEILESIRSEEREAPRPPDPNPTLLH